MHDVALLPVFGVLPIDTHFFSTGSDANQHHFSHHFSHHQEKAVIEVGATAPRLLALPDDYPPPPPR